MMMKKLFCMVAIASVAMMSCSKDDVADGKTEVDALRPGEKTYAVFDIVAGEEGTRTETLTSGSEPAVNEEAAVKEVSIYIFEWTGDNSGTPEKKLENLKAVEELSGDWDIPAEAVLLTPTKKHVIVVANMPGEMKENLSTAFTGGSYESFVKTVAELGDYAGTTDNFNMSSLYTQSGATAPVIVMSGEADPTLESGVTKEEAESALNRNHIRVRVNRLPAKIDVKLGTYTSAEIQTTVTSLPVCEEGGTQVGTVKSCTYDVRNLNRRQYVMSQVLNSGFVSTPHATETVPIDVERYYPIVSEECTFPKKLIAAANDATGNDYMDFVAYMPENTNEIAYKGNTSYVALAASYIPEQDCYVTGFTTGATTNAVVLNTTAFPTSVAEGQQSLFSLDYNIAFEVSSDALSENNIKTLTAYHAAVTLPDKFGGITANDIMIANAVPGFDNGAKMTTAANRKLLTDATASHGSNVLWVQMTSTKNSEGDMERVIFSFKYFVSDGSLPNGFDNSVSIPSTTCGVYTTTAEGLRCYYRVNIFDEYKPKTDAMYYSVIRNTSYHMVISKINTIGYPTQIDLTVTPDEPLAYTNVQVHMIINKWTYKRMTNVEVGM